MPKQEKRTFQFELSLDEVRDVESALRCRKEACEENDEKARGRKWKRLHRFFENALETDNWYSERKRG